MSSFWMKGWKWPYVAIPVIAASLLWGLVAVCFLGEFGSEAANRIARESGWSYTFFGTCFSLLTAWGIACIFRERDYVRRLGKGSLADGRARLLGIALVVTGIGLLVFGLWQTNYVAWPGFGIAVVGVLCILPTIPLPWEFKP